MTTELERERAARIVLENALCTLRDHMKFAVDDARFAAVSEEQADQALQEARSLLAGPPPSRFLTREEIEKIYNDSPEIQEAVKAIWDMIPKQDQPRFYEWLKERQEQRIDEE